MSKVSFRARALDASRPLPVYRDRDCPDLRDCVSISRSVPQLPSGMDTEEEREHHLQRALSAQQVFRDQKEQLVIPVPEAETNTTYYDRLYRGHVPVPKQLIHIQPPGPEQPDYDLDSEDETLLNRLNRKVDVKPLQFENMMERLEKNSTHQQLVSLSEAKQLLSEEDYLLTSVYDHWVRKRRTCGRPSLIPRVKQDRGDGLSNSDVYVAFRRRMEKMQTRKNRKNDEASYEKMLRLRREFSRTVSILDMIRTRETSKRELLLLTLEVLERRYQTFLKDSQVSLCLPLLDKPVNCSHETDVDIKKEQISLRDKLPFNLIRPKKKNMRRDRWYRPQRRPCQVSRPFTVNKTDIKQYDFHSSGDEDEDSPSPPPSPRPPSSSDEDSDADGVFVFRRRTGCQYLSPCTEQTGGAHHPKLLPQCLRHSVTKLTPHWTGLSRRRIGRGGRIILDRASSGLDPVLRHMDSLIRTRTWLLTDPVRLDRDLDENLDLDPSLTKLLNNIQTLRRFCYRPRLSQDQRGRGRSTPETRPGPDITEEQYHCHQLLQMQRQQLEQLHNNKKNKNTAPLTAQSSRSADTSLKTLDSSSAQFAASAVVDARPRPHHGHMTNKNKPSINRLHPPSGPSRPPYSSSPPQCFPTQRSQVGVVSCAHPHTAPPSASPMSALKLAAVAAAGLNQMLKVSIARDTREPESLLSGLSETTLSMEVT